MIAEDEATVVLPPSPSLIPLQTRALPATCAMRRADAGCSSERVGSALTGQGADSGCTENAPISHQTFRSKQDCLRTLVLEAFLMARPHVLLG